MDEAQELRERFRNIANALDAEATEVINGRFKRRVAERIREVLEEVPEDIRMPSSVPLDLSGLTPAPRKNDRMEAPDGCMPNVDVRIVQYAMLDGTLSIRKSVDADNVPLSQISGVVFQGAVEIAVANSQLGGTPDV